MPAAPDPIATAAPFPAAAREDWRALVGAVLRRSGRASDGDPEAALTRTGYDGIPIAPLYTAADAPPAAADPGHAPFVRGSATARGEWDVRQRHADPDPARTNAATLADLTNGVTSLWLDVGDGAIAVPDLARVLDGVLLDLAPIALDAGRLTLAAADALFDVAAAHGLPAAALRGTLGADPIGDRARVGTPIDAGLWPALADRSADHPALGLACIDASVYHDAGGSAADEVAVATAVGVAYLRALTGAGLDVDAALRALEFRFAVDADQFGSIAKLRAARQVWDRVAELAGAGPDRSGQRQHAVTSTAMLTRRDPWTNLLRATIGCFAAAVGGADAISVAPFDAAIGRPDDFARRIARNTQSILHDESSLGRVIDAAGGSWYVESRTEQLAERAWSSFTAIERAGGAAAALEDGTLDRLLATAREARRADIARRRAPITGVSEFALITEEPVLRPPAPEAGGGLLPHHRRAEEFEALRDRSDAYLRDHGVRPRVHLAAPGPSAAHSARVGFAANLFQAAGIEAVPVTGTVAEIAAACDVAGPRVICICSSDEVLAELGVDLARGLHRPAGADGTTHVWLAAPVPGAGRRAELAAAGVDGYVHRGCDALTALRTTLGVLGVAG